MAAPRHGFVVCMIVIAVVVMSSMGGEAKLTTTFYDHSCPQIFSIVKEHIKKAVKAEARMAASLVRLHFHDCFVNGCDGSCLLDNVTKPDGTLLFETEKDSRANINSLRGFDVIDGIKEELEYACPHTVSCADIIAIASRDSAVEVGLVPEYPVYFGRRDSLTANITAADQFLPPPFANYSQLVANFKVQGLNEYDLIALSGAHTIGRVKCALIRAFTLADVDIDPNFQAFLNKTVCPPGSQNPTNPTGRPNNLTFPLTDLDLTTPDKFDSNYYKNLLKKEGMLPSDQTLFATLGTNQKIVREFADHYEKFFHQFAHSTIKMGNISPLEGKEGEIRINCHFPNGHHPKYLMTRVDTQ